MEAAVIDVGRGIAINYELKSVFLYVDDPRYEGGKKEVKATSDISELNREGRILLRTINFADGDYRAFELPRVSLATIQIPQDALVAFEDLYNGLLDAQDNGTGYSPRTADAMKRLKEFMEPAPSRSFRIHLK